MRLGSRHWLAYDRTHFVSIREAQIHVIPLNKCPQNPLLIPEKTWEEDVHLYGSVIKINGLYRMWYYARTEAYGVRTTCYAESEDGLLWRKPELDVADYRGQRTNIVFGTPVMGEGFLESDTVLYTPWDTGREYKMLYVARYPRDKETINAVRIPYYQDLARQYREKQDWQMAQKCEKRVERELARAVPAGVYIATSSDGIHWKEADAPAVPYLDDISHMMYDSENQVYRLYGRGFAYDEGRCRADRDQALFDGYLGRAVFMATSRDAVTWEKEKLVLTADAFDRPGDEIYSMAVFPWEGCYLGWVQMYHGAPDDMTLDIQLAISRDGEHFERVGDRNPILPLGEIGQWDRFNTCVAGLPVIEGERIRVYFNGAVFRHLQITGSGAYGGMDTWNRIVRIGMGETQADRFACAQASFQGGEMLTVPLTLESPRLHLNCESAWGELGVTVLMGDKKETFIVTENSMDAMLCLPQWAMQGEVQLLFTLKNARLYAFWSEGEKQAGG